MNSVSMANRLVTLTLIVERGGVIHTDLQTHDNSYADVTQGLVLIRDELDRVFTEQRKCPYFPADKASAHTKIMR